MASKYNLDGGHASYSLLCRSQVRLYSMFTDRGRNIIGIKNSKRI